MALTNGISPLSVMWKESMRQTCTVYKLTGTSYTGQNTYGQGTEYPCRVGIKTKRIVTNEGDYSTNSQVAIVLPADCDIEAYDKIDLPHPYDQGAVIDEVTTATDQWGQITHKAVRIK